MKNMDNWIILVTLLGYITLLFLISWLTSRKDNDNDAFFTGHHRSPWWIVSIGMIGASISGVSFVSVPGMVPGMQFGYMQMVMGFFVGYLIIASVLLPIYYRLKVTSIYTYLEHRLGKEAYLTGSGFFLVSRLTGSSARLFVAVFILHEMVFSHWNIPFALTAALVLLIIWIYTYQSGIKTVIWTDTLQTLVMLLSVVMIIYLLMSKMDLNLTTLTQEMFSSKNTAVFHWDWMSRQYFWKQFLSGIFIAIVMTGLDQDMMQKNLTCRNLKEAKKNVRWYGFGFIPVNLLFLCLGFLLMYFMQMGGIKFPERTDEILPNIVQDHLGLAASVVFVLGIAAAAFSSADSALTALTTSFSIDFLRVDRMEERKARKIRKNVHVGISVLVLFIVLIVDGFRDKSILDLVYTIASYSYGPILGLFAFAIITKRRALPSVLPYIAVASPFLSELIRRLLESGTSYHMGYELLLINGIITFTGLYISSYSKKLPS